VVVITKVQQARGMRWLVERVSSVYRVAGKK
jgi:hypothetical protein